MSLEVLIVDDDKIIIFLHRIMLEKSELAQSPLSFLNGKEALKYITEDANSNKDYLILLDINMPEMNGWEFLDAIKNKPFANRLFVVIVTSSIDSSDKEQAMKYEHVIDYYEKPIDTNCCMQIKLLPEISKHFNNPSVV